MFPRIGLYGQEMLRVMMVYDPEMRPSAHLLLQHPYFEDIVKNSYFIKASEMDGALSVPSRAALAAVQEQHEE